MQIEKLEKAAEDLKLATLRAKDQGIIGFSHSEYLKREEFQLDDENDFKRLIKDRNYGVSKFSHYFKYKYTSTFSGLTFIYLTNNFLFEGDENKLKVEEDV